MLEFGIIVCFVKSEGKFLIMIMNENDSLGLLALLGGYDDVGSKAGWVGWSATPQGYSLRWYIINTYPPILQQWL